MLTIRGASIANDVFCFSALPHHVGCISDSVMCSMMMTNIRWITLSLLDMSCDAQFYSLGIVIDTRGKISNHDICINEGDYMIDTSTLPQEPEPPIFHENSQAYTQVFKNDIEKQLQEIIDEIVILQSYARSVSKIIPENILSDLSKLIDNCLNEKTLGESLKLALSVHGGLSQVVAPVTVRSLRATDPNQGWINWIKQVWAIPVIFIFTFCAFGFYIYNADLSDKSKIPAPIESSVNK